MSLARCRSIGDYGLGSREAGFCPVCGYALGLPPVREAASSFSGGGHAGCPGAWVRSLWVLGGLCSRCAGHKLTLRFIPQKTPLRPPAAPATSSSGARTGAASPAGGNATGRTTAGTGLTRRTAEVRAAEVRLRGWSDEKGRGGEARGLV